MQDWLLEPQRLCSPTCSVSKGRGVPTSGGVGYRKEFYHILLCGPERISQLLLKIYNGNSHVVNYLALREVLVDLIRWNHERHN